MYSDTLTLQKIVQKETAELGGREEEFPVEHKIQNDEGHIVPGGIEPASAASAFQAETVGASAGKGRIVRGGGLQMICL